MFEWLRLLLRPNYGYFWFEKDGAWCLLDKNGLWYFQTTTPNSSRTVIGGLTEAFGTDYYRDNLEHELREAKTELARHHRDFAKIREIMDEFDKWDGNVWDQLRVVKQIRNVVG